MKTRKIISWSAFPALILFAAFFAVYAMISGTFSIRLVNTFLATNAGAICVTIGVAATIIIGGTDISLGAIVSLTNVAMVILGERGFSVQAAAGIALMAAIAAGAVNGILIGFLRINPLLATFATNAVFSGIALWQLPYPGGTIDFSLNTWYTGSFGLLSMPLLMVCIPLFIWIVWTKTPFGIQVYAIGKHAGKSYATGMNIGAFKFAVHTFAGFAAGIGGLCISATICAGNPTIGSAMSMTSIAAAVIGGISLNGGKGDIWGAVFGAMFLKILISLVVSLNLSSFVQSFVESVIMLIGVVGTIVFSDKELRTHILKPFRKGGGRYGKRAVD